MTLSDSRHTRHYAPSVSFPCGPDADAAAPQHYVRNAANAPACCGDKGRCIYFLSRVIVELL